MTNFRYGLYFYICRCYDDHQGHQYTKLADTLRTGFFTSAMQEAASIITKSVAGRAFQEILEEGWTECGWEGDGDIEWTMLPPYAFNDVQDGWWKPVFHVKQSNNGQSFIASTVPMLSEELEPAKFELMRRGAKG